MTGYGPKRIEKILRANAKNGVVSGNVSSEQFWRISVELRQAIVERAGWDSGGWVFKNWRELPHQLQVDIAWAWKDCMDKGILPDGTPLAPPTSRIAVAAVSDTAHSGRLGRLEGLGRQPETETGLERNHTLTAKEKES